MYAKGKNHCDYLTYQGLPHGSGVEIFLKDSLLKAATQTSDAYDHEHVGPALYNHKDKFKCDFIPAPRRFNYPELRTTIDTYSDFLRANAIINYLGQSEQPYTTEQIIEACKAKSVKYPVVLVRLDYLCFQYTFNCSFHQNRPYCLHLSISISYIFSKDVIGFQPIFSIFSTL